MQLPVGIVPVTELYPLSMIPRVRMLNAMYMTWI
jgi:hypothetical protein